MKTLKEMKIGSEPDETADYWEERDQINKWIADLESVENDISDSQRIFTQKRVTVDTLKNQAAPILANSQNGISENLKNITEQLQHEHQEIEGMINEAYDMQDEVNRIKSDMGECDITVNIQMRKNELI